SNCEAPTQVAGEAAAAAAQTAMEVPPDAATIPKLFEWDEERLWAEWADLEDAAFMSPPSPSTLASPPPSVTGVSSSGASFPAGPPVLVVLVVATVQNASTIAVSTPAACG
ncbi:unnamed protein product, partial [Phaeothamnion confervicola]